MLNTEIPGMDLRLLTGQSSRNTQALLPGHSFIVTVLRGEMVWGLVCLKLLRIFFVRHKNSSKTVLSL